MSIARDWMADAQRRIDRETLEAYATVRRAILDQMDALLADPILRPLTRNGLMRKRRLVHLLADVERQMNFFSERVGVSILRGQQEAVAAAATHSVDAIAAKLPPAMGFTPSFPVRPFSEIVGRLSSGRPLSALLDTLGPQASQVVRDALVRGVGLGLNPRQIARDVSRATTVPLFRATTIARTEMLGSYREATREVMRANRDVLEGWVWDAQLGPRTCASCIAQHGSVHRVDEPMATHPNCRCAMSPLTKTWGDLGFPGVGETRIEPRPGAEWFGKASPAVQLRILGPTKLAAYRAGRVSLGDFVQRTDSRVWGQGSREASLATAMASARMSRRAAA